MTDGVELAKEGIEQAHHAEHGGEQHGGGSKGHSDKLPRRIAIMIAVLAAALAIAELGEKAAQNEYITKHVTLSDTWAFYQAKTIRRAIYLSDADVIDSLSNADPAAAKRVKDMRDQAARMADDPKTNEGTKQLAERAKQETEERDHHFHQYHQFELATGALQIAIVLASVSVITRMIALTYAAGILGLGAAIWSGLVLGGIV